MRLLAALSALAFAAAARAGPTSSAAAEVASLLPGTYLSRDAGGSVRVAVAAVPKSRIGDGAVFYVEAARTARPGAPFLQRFLRLEEDGARVALRVYDPRDLAGVRGKWREPDSLELFTARDVLERPDCRMTLAKAPAGHWAGGTASATCFSAFANARLAVSISVSPQTLEWREEGRDAAGKAVYGPTGEITIFGREAAGAAPPPPPAALAAPAAGGAGRNGGFSSKVNEPATEAPPVLEVTGRFSPSKKYGMTDLRGISGADRVPVERLLPAPAAEERGATVVVVTSRSGAVSVFSFAEISPSSSDAPSLDLSGAAPRLVAAGGRGLSDVVSIEVRVLSPPK